MRSHVVPIGCCAVLILILAPLGGDVAGAPSGAPAQLVLRESARAGANRVRLSELCEGELSPRWGSLVVMDAPAPGADVELTRGRLRRLLSQIAPAPVPRLAGAERCRISRAGHQVSTSELEAQVLEELATLPLPAGALEQRFELVPGGRLGLPAGGFDLRLLSSPPEVGPGNARFELKSNDGTTRIFHVGVRRELSAECLHAATRVRATQELDQSQVTPQIIWIGNSLDWRQACRSRGEIVGASLMRTLDAGALLLRRDLRATPIVLRLAPVQWIVERGGVRVNIATRARNNGALGDWVWVESPFGQRLMRVKVVGPGMVGETESVHASVTDRQRGR